MTPLITPPPRTSSLVVDRMHELIRDNVWPVGARIPAEPELVEQFGVGRNTIREAVRALEHSGLLMPRRGDGTYVRSRNVLVGALTRATPDPVLTDLVSTRRALETEAAELAAQRADADDIARLRAKLEAAVAALDADDVTRYAQLDIEFHATIVEISGNRLLMELYEGVGEVMRRTHEAIAAGATHDGHPDGHHEVVAAIADGSPERARAAVHTYLDIAREVVR
ncbi:FadR/GntR family transcriptional regulator [Gordonia sp. DT30]|uniref:FadR/GntR family transcriptional regulator n=1 Tax=unclassified Gordonia (in: high G+C Gram-positive bacteria) TaxID=2657482 RepID=UPI003CF93BA6